MRNIQTAVSPHPLKILTHVYMNLFTRNSPYYHLLKYLIFLLKHPVCMVRQFNSWNDAVKAKFAYSYTNSCCHLRNPLLVKLCTSWDDGATAGNSRMSFSGIPRSNVFTLRWMSERSANLCLFRAFFNFEKNQKIAGGKVRWITWMVHFCNKVLSLGTREFLTQGHCHGGESTYQARVWVFSSEQIPVTLSAFPNDTVDLLFVLLQLTL